MKHIIAAIAIMLAVIPLHAKTLRVNNTPGSGAQYTTLNAAMEAAVDGDIIIIDGSEKLYEDATINKNVTVKGPGYFLEANGITTNGNPIAEIEVLKITAKGATISGLCIYDQIHLKADEVTVTRCHVHRLYFETTSNNQSPTKVILHQNYLRHVGGSATYCQITNNIIADSGTQSPISGLDQSVISRNTFTAWKNEIRASNSTLSRNIGKLTVYGNGNSLTDNYEYENYDELGFTPLDSKVQARDAKLSANHGAFSGEDPYVISGLSTGAYLKSIDIPESVVQGELLKGHITIGMSR